MTQDGVLWIRWAEEHWWVIVLKPLGFCQQEVVHVSCHTADTDRKKITEPRTGGIARSGSVGLCPSGLWNGDRRSAAIKRGLAVGWSNATGVLRCLQISFGQEHHSAFPHFRKQRLQRSMDFHHLNEETSFAQVMSIKSVVPSGRQNKSKASSRLQQA